MLNEVTVLNIREYLAATENGRFGEEELKELLSEFSCSKRNESQSEEIAKIDSIAKSSITETPGKAPKKALPGVFYVRSQATKVPRHILFYRSAYASFPCPWGALRRVSFCIHFPRL